MSHPGVSAKHMAICGLPCHHQLRSKQLLRRIAAQTGSALVVDHQLRRNQLLRRIAAQTVTALVVDHQLRSKQLLRGTSFLLG